MRKPYRTHSPPRCSICLIFKTSIMKPLFISCVLFLIFISANAQLTKHNWMLGGAINFSSIHRNSEAYGPSQVGYTFNITPNIGYFPLDKFAVGFKTGINKSGYKAPGTPGYNKYTEFNIGAYSRYYFLSTEKNINILSEAAYLYGFEKGNQNDPASKNTFVFSAGPVVYFNTSVGIEFLVSYSTSKFVSVKGSNNIIMVGLGLQVHLEKEE